MKTNKLIFAATAVVLVILAIFLFKEQPNPDDGRIVVGITDAAASIDSVSSILITVNKVEMEGSGGWVTVASSPKQYDLLDLRDSGDISLYAESDIKAGTYNQMRLMVSKVVVVANGVEKEAKLPSGELKIVGKFVVNKGKTSTVVVDFLADKSLHVTGIGEFIFAPVVKVESRSEANVEVSSGGVIAIIGGKIETDAVLGMDENGEIKSNFVLDPNARLDIVGGALKIMVQGESDASVKISSKSAVDAAIMGGYIDSALSVKFTTKDGKKVWRVIGTKTLFPKTVYVDAVTGAILGVE